VCEEGMARFCT
jgi:hypothetical protein